MNKLSNYPKSDWINCHVLVTSSSQILPNYEGTVLDSSKTGSRALVKGHGGSPLAKPKWVESHRCEVLSFYEEKGA